MCVHVWPTEFDKNQEKLRGKKRCWQQPIFFTMVHTNRRTIRTKRRCLPGAATRYIIQKSSPRAAVTSYLSVLRKWKLESHKCETISRRNKLFVLWYCTRSARQPVSYFVDSAVLYGWSCGWLHNRHMTGWECVEHLSEVTLRTEILLVAQLSQ